MPLTPETLPRHELCGLRVRVVESTDPGRVGVAGEVVRETMRTLVVDTGSESDRDAAGDGSGDAGVTQVPKAGTTFEFRLEGGEDSHRDRDRDEAAAAREGAGTASELPSETAGLRAGQSGGCEGAAYVTVDGEVLLSRPALRTENVNGVDTRWQ
jgi:ribonuclease P protein subunit POP4